MSKTVDVRTCGWNNPDCVGRQWVDDSYEDDDGHWHASGYWDDKLLCESVAVNAKTDHCKRCGKTLVYP